MKPIKCINCKKELKKEQIHKEFSNTKYYHNYHRTYHKKTRWCENCWNEHLRFEEESKKSNNRKLLEQMKAGDFDSAVVKKIENEWKEKGLI
jgi:hypothetical protein